METAPRKKCLRTRRPREIITPLPAAASRSDRRQPFSSRLSRDRSLTFTEAIRLDPKLNAPYNNRGLAYGAKGDYDRAIADLTEAIRLDPRGNTYSMLWGYLAQGRAGENGTAKLAASAARLKTKDWPYSVIEFYLGKRSAVEMLSATAKPDERCEAQFYLGRRDAKKAEDLSREIPLRAIRLHIKAQYARPSKGWNE
jgi:tetratricopeptide (TPR) repeat protein